MLLVAACALQIKHSNRIEKRPRLRPLIVNVISKPYRPLLNFGFAGLACAMFLPEVKTLDLNGCLVRFDTSFGFLVLDAGTIGLTAIGCHAGTRCFLPLPIKSSRPIRLSASRSIGQLLGS